MTLSEKTFARNVDGYCNIRTYKTRDDANAAAADWNGIYEDARHHAEATRLGAAWCVAVYDGYLFPLIMPLADAFKILGYANGI